MKLTNNRLKIYLVIFGVHLAITVYVILQSLSIESNNYASGLIQGVIIAGSWVITLKWFNENVFCEVNSLISEVEVKN